MSLAFKRLIRLQLQIVG